MRYPLLFAVAAFAIMGRPEVATAVPIAGSISVSGLPPAGGWTALALNVDLGMKGSPWGLMGQYQVGMSGTFRLFEAKPQSFDNPQVLHGLIRYRTDVFGTDSLTMFAGLNFYQGADTYSDPGFRLDPKKNEPLIGLTYTLRSGRIWVNLTPHYLFPQYSDPYMHPWFFRSGVALVETGITVAEGLDLSLRLAFTPVRLTYRY